MATATRITPEPVEDTIVLELSVGEATTLTRLLYWSVAGGGLHRQRLDDIESALSGAGVKREGGSLTISRQTITVQTA